MSLTLTLPGFPLQIGYERTNPQTQKKTQKSEGNEENKEEKEKEEEKNEEEERFVEQGYVAQRMAHKDRDATPCNNPDLG